MHDLIYEIKEAVDTARLTASSFELSTGDCLRGAVLSHYRSRYGREPLNASVGTDSKKREKEAVQSEESSRSLPEIPG